MDILAKNLLILASAGSGKTFQLANRIIGLVSRGEDPEKIVALTFTKKAAGEFTDSVLTKLAEAASSHDAAGKLRAELRMPHADFIHSLHHVVRSLPRMTFGTMDGFFAGIVKAYQYDLGLSGGRFDLLEGPGEAAAAEEILAEILGDSLARPEHGEFLHAYRRATMGREDQNVGASLTAFVNRWQSIYQEATGEEWGPLHMVAAVPEQWEKDKSRLAALAARGLDAISYTDKRQRAALEREIGNIGNHVVGSGSLGSSPSPLLAAILDAVATTPSGPLAVRFFKPFNITSPTSDVLREMLRLAAQCEAAAALRRTRAVREVIAVFDAIREKRFRRRGLLGFNDIKLLMGQWARDHEARGWREAIDFRLDARIDHWLLDEFQDTSRADWTGLQPLAEEAAMREDGTFFVVGDKKQAIFAWRGGDVTLFDSLSARFRNGIAVETMIESWRSCPEVLELVNRVAGDGANMQTLFGNAASMWEWMDHRSAKPLAMPAKRGLARVEMVENRDARLSKTVEILHEIGVGKRALSCGILLRGNSQVRETTDFLRLHGFDVIEEGSREPSKDGPVGIALCHLLKWLAAPSDRFAREVVAMSPLSATLREHYGDDWRAVWTNLSDSIASNGFLITFDILLAPLLAHWSAFGQRRASEILSALSSLDRQGVSSPGEAASWIERLNLSQSPGVAAVQVMTIHKAKGLGFDVVILPEIPDESIPQPQYFDVARGRNWLSQTPPKWARAMVPEFDAVESQWSLHQRYEAFCILYVALTRAKRGLYLLLEPPARSSDPVKPSLENWVRSSTCENDKPGIHWTRGSPSWFENIQNLPEIAIPSPDRLKAAVSKPIATFPSSLRHAHSSTSPPIQAVRSGTALHHCLEQITWADEVDFNRRDLPHSSFLARLLANPKFEFVFYRHNRPIRLLREHPIDAIAGNQHISGTIDRLHLHLDSDGRVVHVEIFDFKTDSHDKPETLRDKYTGQMTAYRETLACFYPQAKITTWILSTHFGTLLELAREDSSVRFG